MEFFKKIFHFFVVMFALFGFLIFLIVAGGVTAAVTYAKKQELLKPSDTVLTLTVDENIRENASRDRILREIIGPQVTLLDIVSQLENAASDPHVKGLLVRVSDHELSYAQIQEIRDAVIAFRKSGKPTVAFADSFGELSRGMASYYLATAFEEIYVQPSGMVDISGIAAENVFLKGLLAKLGAEPIGATRKEYKNAWNIFTEEKYTGPHREAVHRLLESVFDRTVADIAAARKLDPAKVRELIDRAPLFSGEALAEKLVDGVKYRDEVLALMEQKSAGAGRTPLSRYEPIFPDLNSAATIAVVIAEGEIMRGRSEQDPFGRRSTIGSDTLAKAIRDAAADPEVQAIVLRVDSPGGSVVASETIWHEVAKAVKDTDKPLIVTMSSLAASGGYYISMAADRIIAEPATITGSIGVIIGKFYTPEMWKKIGVTFDAEQFGKNARLFSSLTRPDAEQNAMLQKTLDAVYDTFVTRAADGRKKKPEELEQHAKGRVWSGADALERGLVDELGGYPAAFAAVRTALGLAPDSLLSLKFYPEEPMFLDLILDRTRDDDEAGTRSGLWSDFTVLLRRIAAIAAVMEQFEKGGVRLESEPVDLR
ncbi:MAG TPA: signal peptide peptidase SppA [bacterium]|nr:signal peptide peptidase SppA [bacterium]